MPVIEMRTYWTQPGKRDEFLEIFRTRSIPLHREIGMPIVGPFLGLENPDTFFFMRFFPTLESREALKARFYEGEPWTSELEQKLMPLLDRWEVILVEDTPHIGRALVGA